MPIVSIKLNNDTERRNKSVNAEFAADKMLGQIFNTQRIEQFIADDFNRRGFPFLLNLVHLDKAFALNRIGISAGNRAVLNFVLLSVRRRTAKFFTANLTSMFDLVPALIGVRVCHTAEVIPTGKMNFCFVNHFAAMITGNRFACFPCFVPASFGAGLLACEGTDELFTADFAVCRIASGSNSLAFSRAVFSAALSRCCNGAKLKGSLTLNAVSSFRRFAMFGDFSRFASAPCTALD